MGKVFGKISVLTEEEMQRLHEKDVRILRERGMRVDFAGPQRYPERIPMRYTAMYLSTFARQPRPGFDLNTGGFPPYVRPLDRQRRYANMEDVRQGLRLADALPN